MHTLRGLISVLIVIWVAFLCNCSFIHNDVFERTNPLHRQGRIDLGTGKNVEAQIVLSEALAKWPTERPACPELAAIYNNMGRSLAAQGDYQEAITYYQKGIDIFVDAKRASCVHPILAVLRNNLCESRMAVPGAQHIQSNRDECLAAYESNMSLPNGYFALLTDEDIAWGLWNWGGPGGNTDVTEISSKIQNSRLNNERKSDVLFELGHMAVLKNEPVNAEMLHREALIRRVSALGVWHPKTTVSATALMLCQGRFSEALEYQRMAMGMNSTASDQLGYSKFVLGLALANETSNPQVAYELYAQALKSCKPVDAANPCAGMVSANQPATVTLQSARCISEMEQRARIASLSLHGMARALKKMDPQHQVDTLYRMALTLRETTFGSRHPITLQSHLCIAQALETSRQSLHEAEQAYEVAVKIAEVAYGPKDELVGAIYADLGRVRQAQGQTASAMICLQTACEILPGLQPDELWQRARALEDAYDGMCFMQQLHGTGTRTVIARDPPHLPRDHATPYEFLKKKVRELAHLFDNNPDPELLVSRFENICDDPIDDIKHELHGSKIFSWRVFLLMDGANDPCMKMDRPEISAENL